ncbi:MAG: type I restriction endonuclease subunit R [Polyangia bacterium]
MTARDWNELHQSELPAAEVLSKLGWTHIPIGGLDAERTSTKDGYLRDRMLAAIRRLNPWISDDNANRAYRTIANVQATSLLEANELLYTALTYGISLEQDLGDGTKGHTVRFIDFDDPGNNDLCFVQQFEVNGSRKLRIPDIVCFVNGIPITVVECKNPALGDKWRGKAIGDLHMYQELGDEYRGVGIPRLFETAQILIGCCGQAAVLGTVSTPARFFSEWKIPYPETTDEVGAELGRTPTPQDVMLWSVVRPENLLDIVRNFIVFDKDADTGHTVKKVCRYQQYAAVNKALRRTRTARKPDERGGVVWHTQGSGKSLTMLWLCLKLRREPYYRNPTLVLVTDRRSLDKQIEKTFRNCGFPNPERAESVRDLRELLTEATGKTVLTTIQKFQELVPQSDNGSIRKKLGEHPTLSEAANVFVLVDEAHRTQYRALAANMRQALPNACFLGFSGTPIDKHDRSTIQTFGPYIDTYTIEQAVADGAIVPIFYESRLPELRIVGATVDQLFDRVFAERSREEREAIKDRYASETAIAEAPKRIEAICLDLIRHFETHVRPNGFKAQVVACTRDAAVTYKETLDAMGAPESAIIMSGAKGDSERLVRHHTDENQRREAIERFLKSEESLSILVVCDMLLTGFDAPIEQVMYLDSFLREHNLLQAIARTNRPRGEHKRYGLVVDYWGVSDALQEALAIFAPGDIEGALRPKTDELPRLQTRHAVAMRYMDGVGDKDDLNECVYALSADDVRAEFDLAFKRFGQSMDMLLPDSRALAYADDFRWLGKVRQAARARYRDGRADVSDCGGKARKLIEEAVAADGVKILVKQVNLFSAEFEKKLEALESDDARASEMEHAIRHEIHVRLEENPVFYTSLIERLEQIITELREKRIEAAEALQLMLPIRTDVQRPEQAAQKLGLSATGHAIYGLLKRAELGDRISEVPATWDGQPLDDGNLGLAATVEREVGPLVEIVDWHVKDDVQREIRKRIKRKLRGHVDQGKLDRVAAEVVDLIKVRRKP